MNYKKIIKNQELRFKILELLEFIPDELMIKIQYAIKTNRRLNLKKPERLTEKIQWYKLNYRDPLMTQCADKYAVREYVKRKGCEEILVPLIGVYEQADQIDFEKFPNEFVLKTTNGSHTNIICKDKNKLDYEKTAYTLNDWINNRTAKLGREWAYYDIPPLIVCEEFLVDEENPDADLRDYKFICFNGKVKYVWVDVDRYTDHKRNFYDLEWNFIDVGSDVPNCGDIIQKPDGLLEMIEIAKKLSQGFPNVRVDLYWLNNRIYFGELTFYSFSGYETYNPDEFDYTLGNEFVLPEKIR